MKNKKGLIIGIIGVIVIIVIIIVVINVKNSPSSNNNENNNSSEGTNQPEDKTEDKVTAVSTFDITNLQVEEKEKNELSMFFKLTNKNNSEITNKQLTINIYDGNTLLYEYGYLIEDLDALESVYVQANATFQRDKITKYEFVIDSEKVVVEPSSIK